MTCIPASAGLERLALALWPERLQNLLRGRQRLMNFLTHIRDQRQKALRLGN